MESNPKMHWRNRENSSTKWKFKIAGFEIPNEFIRAVTENAEEAEEKLWDVDISI